ncbi:hypothetical protein FRC04_000973 [Tulasnella sp. 424]|nr:hypothetical protein FRC04_000973 [Tulasnella sp. 424]KAG8977884.1 hypothetical protein FRC05_000412 [Tulasnella sp. 425]
MDGRTSGEDCEPEADSLAVCVYCAASPGAQPEYRVAAESLGEALAASGRSLVYGGGNRGLMGIVSNAVIQHGGSVTAVALRAMVLVGGEGHGPVERGNVVGLSSDPVPAVNEGNHKSIVVESIHQRKILMARLAGGGFVGLPGGFGTFEEVLGAITWNKLGIHKKPVVLLNVNGFYEPLRALIEGAIKETFIQEKNRHLVTFVQPPDGVSAAEFDWGKAAIEALDAWKMPSDAGPFVWDEKNKWSLT